VDAAQVSLLAVKGERWTVIRWVWVGLLLLAWALRLPPTLRTPLHPDEALYGYWGLLIGRGRDPWLISGPIFKPPLLPYVISAFQLLLGRTSIALRLPGLVAGLLMVPLAGALAQALYRSPWIEVSAAGVMALSPFAITLSGTAFPDPLMVALGLAACLAAARGRVSWAGLLAGLSFATKQTGLVWLPLVLSVALARRLRPERRMRAFIVPYLAPLMLASVWDGVRVALGGGSFWSAGVAGYGGLRLIWPHELWPRLRTWVSLAASLFESPPINVLLLVGLPLLVWWALTRRARERRAFFDQLLISFCLIYVLLHWLVAFPTWRRYLLPLVPILAVLVGRVGEGAVSLVSRRLGYKLPRAVGALLLVTSLIVPAWQAGAGRSSAAEEHAIYRGIERVVSFFSQLPEGSVVYHHWLGWHYHYALFDAPVYLAYWPTPAWLARDVQAFGAGDPRYVAFPAWESSARVAGALEDVGYALEPVLTVSRERGGRPFVVYHVVPASA
jgi:4-amino-4-deoxy-L-arabinose transferase-like glycosyltransferase